MTIMPMSGRNPEMPTFDDPVAALLARRPETGAISPVGQMPTTSEPFVWGAGGARLTPQQLAQQQEVARAMMQSDYSPIASPWQGLGRVADNVLGAVDMKRLDKEAASSNAALQAQIAAALGPQNADIAGLIASGDKGAMGIADNVYAARTPKQAAPHFWESNDGSQWTIGPDGQAKQVYKDPTPKITWIQADNGDGTKTLIPMGASGPLGQQGGGDPASAAGGMPAWWMALSPEERAIIEKQGQSRLGSSIPSGSPLSPPKTLPPDFDFGDGR